MLNSRAQPGADTALKLSLQDLSRLLSRLQRQIQPSASTDAGAELRTSVYLRRKTGANVEYARALLLRLEHDVAAVKVTSRRAAWTTELRAHRDTVARLNRALIEMDQLDDASGSDSAEDEGAPAALPSAQQQPQTSTLRPRAGAALRESDIKASGRGGESLQTREEMLSSHQAEQDAIKASLVDLAAALKASNVDFSRSLEEEKSVLDRAVTGLDRNALGMEAAERKMGTLRKMTEGQGWYGRIKLYALIAALWLAAFLLVFVGPKLRF
ncbi:hypothetical protein ANO11243_058870 [Dothideomycetidae sp. 11243]|nr:hypothetical protein ANO11243_058870 [fungal sp. No.11243]